MGAYEVVTFRGKRVDKMTRAALLAAERKLGYQLAIVQGSYNAGGVKQSAGTHDGGGVVDLTAFDWQRKVRVLRSVGWAAWYREARPGVWAAHIHAVLVGHGRLSDAAKAQEREYLAGFDGMSGDGRDPHTREFVNVRFQYPPLRPTPHITAVLKAETVEERVAALRLVAASGSPEARVVAEGYLDAIENMLANRSRRKRLHSKLAEMEVRG